MEGKQHTSVLLPGEFLGQRSLAGYSPWGCKELDTTEVTAAAAYCILLLPELEASLGTLFKNLESMILSKFAIVVFVF